MTPLTDSLVVDASVAVKWHLPDEADADAALSLLERLRRREVTLVAPDHIHYEVPSAITVATRGRTPRLTQDQGRDAIDEFLALDIITLDTAEIVRAAYPLAHRHDCAFYDALYLALAQQLDIPFITADRRLYDRIRHLPNMIWIGDYAPPGRGAEDAAEPTP